MRQPTFRARAGHRTPPGVMSPTRLEFAEGVHEARAHKRAEAVALLDGETVVADVGLGVREVNLGVRHVEVAAKDDGLFLLQLFQVAQKILVPNLTVRQPFQFALGVGRVNIHEEKILIFCGEHAAFVVVLGDAEMRRDFERNFFRENRRAGIAFFCGGVPKSRVARRPELLDLVGRAFGFLQAKDVGLLGVEEFKEFFLKHGAQAVDVPGNEFHAMSLRKQMANVNSLYAH